LPEIVILDKGQEFSGTTLDAWGAQHGVPLHFIQTGMPVRNTFIESFNGTFLDDCLNKHWFLTFQDGQVVLEVWRQEYNAERAHSAIEAMTPTEYSTLS
jgi:putative transposase